MIDVETDPTVKLLDLRLSSEVGAVQQTVNRYQSRADELPAANKVGSVYYSIDFEKLNMDKVMVLSPYTNQYLSLIMDENGTVGIHYDFDLAHVMREFEIQASENDRDIRHWLTDHYPFVPIKSFPYVLKDGEPHLK